MVAMTRGERVFLAKLCEKLLRWDDMAKYAGIIVKTEGQNINIEEVLERIVMRAYKNAIRARRQESDVVITELAQRFANELEEQILEISQEYIELMQSLILNNPCEDMVQRYSMVIKYYKEVQKSLSVSKSRQSAAGWPDEASTPAAKRPLEASEAESFPASTDATSSGKKPRLLPASTPNIENLMLCCLQSCTCAV